MLASLPLVYQDFAGLIYLMSKDQHLVHFGSNGYIFPGMMYFFAMLHGLEYEYMAVKLIKFLYQVHEHTAKCFYFQDIYFYFLR